MQNGRSAGALNPVEAPNEPSRYPPSVQCAIILDMKMFRLFGAWLACCALVGQAPAQVQPPKKKLLAIGEVKGFEHDSVSHALATLEKLGRQTGLWDTYIRTDAELLTKSKLANNAKNLTYFDAVVF